MSALTPGIYDPEEAPWWEFTCDAGDATGDFEPFIRRWMGEAARDFATVLDFRHMGGGIKYLACEYLTLDGMTGTYLLELHRHPTVSYVMVVTRNPVPVPAPNPKRN